MRLVELLNQRFCALKNLSFSGSPSALKARQFLMETMVDAGSALAWIEHWGPVLSDSGAVEILASRSDEKLNVVFFRVSSSLENVSSPRHAIAFFAGKNKGAELKLSHELDMDVLWRDFCVPPALMADIRQLGDAVLHQEALPVQNVNDSAVSEQIRMMKEDLVATGGVGIAANQCARIKKPLSIVLSGVDYDCPEHVAKVMRRYPSVFFPPMMICINPQIIHQCEEKEFFAEGCLSVRSPFRAQVSRAHAVTVRYQDPAGEWCRDDLCGVDARVMLHEIDHIRNGKVYIQHIIDELTREQCKIIYTLIDEVIHQGGGVSNPMQSPTLLFDRDADGRIVFDVDLAKKLFAMTDFAVLAEMSDILRCRIFRASGASS